MEASNSISECGVIWIDVIECGVDASLLYKGVKDKYFPLHSLLKSIITMSDISNKRFADAEFENIENK